MLTINEALALAIKHNQAGRLQVAEQIYQQILVADPNQADAIHHLGVLAHQVGKHELAIEYFERAIELRGKDAAFHNNLGETFRALGRIPEAIACYRRAIELKPDIAATHSNLGNALYDHRALKEAVDCYLRAIELKPDYAEAHNNLGAAFKYLGKLEDAVVAYRRAIELMPDCAEAYNNLGVALNAQGKLGEAVVCFLRTLELKPNDAEAHNNLGVAFKDQGRLEDAAACYRRALELDSQNVAAHWNHSLLRLLLGDFESGWREYEWRWQRQETPPRSFPQPLWQGDDLAGRTILLYAEQGLGDTLQFVRFVSLVKARGAKVILEVQQPLLSLLADFPADQVMASGTKLPEFDVHVPLLSLPAILQTNLQSIPAKIPYLFASPLLVDRWRERLGVSAGVRIGIMWQGNPAWGSDRTRSVRLAYFAALAEIPGVQLISLQKGAGLDQLSEVRDLFPVMDLSKELDVAAGPFMDTAAIMMNLDLVVTVDSVLGHLAGALGVPFWIVLPLVPDWRWLLDRDDSPWYPTARLFRQRRLDDWTSVFDEMRTAIRQQFDT